MDRDLPQPFAALAHLAGSEPTIGQAHALGQALNAVPGLQAWLRAQRQAKVRALLDAGHTKQDLAPHLGVTPQRVADIAAGHRRSRTPRP